jgi:hypothetical protein
MVDYRSIGNHQEAVRQQELGQALQSASILEAEGDALRSQRGCSENTH